VLEQIAGGYRAIRWRVSLFRSARERRDNIVHRSDAMPWYGRGPCCWRLLESAGQHRVDTRADGSAFSRAASSQARSHFSRFSRTDSPQAPFAPAIRLPCSRQAGAQKLHASVTWMGTFRGSSATVGDAWSEQGTRYQPRRSYCLDSNASHGCPNR